MKIKPPPQAPSDEPSWCTTKDTPSKVARYRVPKISATSPPISGARPGHYSSPIAAANSSVEVCVGGITKYAANISERRM